MCLALTVVLTKLPPELPQSSKEGGRGVQPLERSQGRRYRERFLVGLDGEPDGPGVQKAQHDASDHVTGAPHKLSGSARVVL